MYININHEFIKKEQTILSKFRDRRTGKKKGTLNEHDRMAEFYMKNRRKKINYWNKTNTIAINKDNGG